MREIKFRAWNKKEKCMRQVDSIYFPLGKPSGKDITVYNEEEDCYEWMDEDEYELMEYTGMKDCNDKEIYEGDIVNYGVYGNYKVVYNKSSFKIQRLDSLNENLHLLEERCFDDILILGNIYENPELLEEV